MKAGLSITNRGKMIVAYEKCRTLTRLKIAAGFSSPGKFGL